MCWCAVKNLHTHSLTSQISRKLNAFLHITTWGLRSRPICRKIFFCKQKLLWDVWGCHDPRCILDPPVAWSHRHSVGLDVLESRSTLQIVDDMQQKDHIHCESKNCAIFVVIVTLENFNRFLKLFHCRNQKLFRHKAVVKVTTSPEFCRCTTL